MNQRAINAYNQTEKEIPIWKKQLIKVENERIKLLFSINELSKSLEIATTNLKILNEIKQQIGKRNGF